MVESSGLRARRSMTSSKGIPRQSASSGPQEMRTSVGRRVSSSAALPPSTTSATYAPVSSRPELSTRPIGRFKLTTIVSPKEARGATAAPRGAARDARRAARARGAVSDGTRTEELAACIVVRGARRGVTPPLISIAVPLFLHLDVFPGTLVGGAQNNFCDPWVQEFCPRACAEIFFSPRPVMHPPPAKS